MLQQAEDFKKQAAELLRNFEANGPFTSNISTEDALGKVQEMYAEMEALKEQEKTIRKGLNIFKIDQPPSKDIDSLNKDLENIKQVWELTKQWETHWSEWKV